MYAIESMQPPATNIVNRNAPKLENAKKAIGTNRKTLPKKASICIVLFI